MGTLALIGLGYLWPLLVIVTRTTLQVTGGIAGIYLAFQAGGPVSVLLLLLGLMLVTATFSPFLEAIAKPGSWAGGWMTRMATWLSCGLLVIGMLHWLMMERGFMATVFFAIVVGGALACLLDHRFNRGYKTPPMSTHQPVD